MVYVQDVFTKMLKVPLAYLRKNFGINISAYLDDTLILSDTPGGTMEAAAKAAEIFQDLGYMISREKSVIVPTQRIEFL